MSELNDKHKLFVAEYIIQNCNATKAYQAAYGCDYETARANGSRLLINADIKSEIDREIQKILDDKKSLALQIVNEYKKIAFSNIAEFINPETGETRCNEETDTTPLESIEIKHTRDGSTIKYKLSSKISALDALSKYVVGFTEKKEISVTKLDRLLDEIEKL